MPAIPAAQHQTAAAIFALHEAREAAEAPRQYLGASVIGHPCARYLWLSFRLTHREQFTGRMLRLFERGRREEAFFIDDLRAIGVEVHELAPDGQQFRVEAHGGHFAGHMDGCARGLPEAPVTWHVLEFKTHNAKSFRELAAKGVQEAKPMHWAQMQVYMALTGMDRAMYLAVCKDDDSLHAERVALDKEAARRLLERAERIIFADEPPQRLSTNPSWWQCKLCSMHEQCHGTAAPRPTCRSCAHVTPERDGTWTCEQHKIRAVPFEHQLLGCQAHRFIPILLDTWAEKINGSDESNTVLYRNALTGREFCNSEGGASDYSSVEIHAAADKRAIGDPAGEEFRAHFDAEVVG